MVLGSDFNSAYFLSNLSYPSQGLLAVMCQLANSSLSLIMPEHHHNVLIGYLLPFTTNAIA